MYSSKEFKFDNLETLQDVIDYLISNNFLYDNNTYEEVYGKDGKYKYFCNMVVNYYINQKIIVENK